MFSLFAHYFPNCIVIATSPLLLATAFTCGICILDINNCTFEYLVPPRVTCKCDLSVTRASYSQRPSPSSIDARMPSTSIPTSRYPTPPISSLADPFDFAKKEALPHSCGGDSVVSTPSSALHRIFTEEVDIWHEIMLYSWIYGTLRLRQASDVWFRIAVNDGRTLLNNHWASSHRLAVSSGSYLSREYYGASSCANSALYMECHQRHMTWIA